MSRTIPKARMAYNKSFWVEFPVGSTGWLPRPGVGAGAAGEARESGVEDDVRGALCIAWDDRGTVFISDDGCKVGETVCRKGL